MNKLEKYKQEFSNLKENFSNENLSKEQIIGQLNILQIELTFEIISALQIIAKQNKNNGDCLDFIKINVKEIMGEPIELIMGENNDTDNGKTN